MKDKFEQKAKEELFEEQQKKDKAEQEEKIKLRANELKQEHDKQQNKIAEEEEELANCKSQRMKEIQLKDLIDYECPKCHSRCKVHMSQLSDALCIWSYCTNCEVVPSETIKFDETYNVNFPIRFCKIKVSEFFTYNMLSGVSTKDLEHWATNQKSMDERDNPPEPKQPLFKKIKKKFQPEEDFSFA